MKLLFIPAHSSLLVEYKSHLSSQVLPTLFMISLEFDGLSLYSISPHCSTGNSLAYWCSFSPAYISIYSICFWLEHWTLPEENHESHHNGIGSSVAYFHSSHSFFDSFSESSPSRIPFLPSNLNVNWSVILFQPISKECTYHWSLPFS